MIDKMFAVYDLKMNLFMSPYCGRNVDSGIRSFGDMVANPQAPFSKHPEDYVLYVVGEFDVEKGIVTAVSPIHVVSKALDFVRMAGSSAEKMMEEVLTDAKKSA